jgi:hypothetical protein
MSKHAYGILCGRETLAHCTFIPRSVDPLYIILTDQISVGMNIIRMIKSRRMKWAGT